MFFDNLFDCENRKYTKPIKHKKVFLTIDLYSEELLETHIVKCCSNNEEKIKDALL